MTQAALAKPAHPGARGATTALRDLNKTRPLRVMTDDDWYEWQTHGYVVIRNVIPEAQVRAVRDMLWRFQEMDPNDPGSWNKPQHRDHKMTELNNTGMVEVYHHQALWDTRQNPKLYDLFVDIWDREDLWVSIDRANHNTPNRGVRAPSNDNGFIHFDVDSSARPLPVSVQGVLALSEQDEETGGFQCVPGLFRDFDYWSSQQPTDANPYQPDISGYDIVSVPLNPGDMLIFNALLPHGVRPNRSNDRVRQAQYICMFPADEANTSLRDERIHMWQQQRPPKGDAFPGDPRQFERKFFDRAELSPLGEKLLGLRQWSEENAP